MSKIAILGATGAVGRQMLQCLEEAGIEVDDLRLFASNKSSGKTLFYKDLPYTVEALRQDSFTGVDYVLGASSNEVAKQYRDEIVKAGAIFIDNSSAFRLEKDVPLVVAGINDEDAFKHNGVIANPNCSTIIALTALAPLLKLGNLKTLVASTYQAVSGAGTQGIIELSTQIEDIRSDRKVEPKVFSQQIAYNAIGQIGSLLENGYTSEEVKMQNEGQKILHLPDLKVSCTCVRVPVFRSHSISMIAIFDKDIDLEEAKANINAFAYTTYFEDEVPTPLKASNQDLVFVGRLRKDMAFEHGVSLFCCGDQIRKGAATNAIDILKLLEKGKM